jgi:hypothetical protein
MLTNKEVIDRLVEYLYCQERGALCRALANFMIDLQRVNNINHLPEDEKKNLLIRIRKNSETLQEFIENGSTKPLTIGPLND